MQKNVPKYTPDWVRTVSVWAEASKRDVRLRAVQRPAHPAVVRQPAGRRVPPRAVHGRPGPTTSPIWCSTSTRPGRRRSPPWSAAAQLVRQALDERRPGRGGEDQRRQGHAPLRPAGRRDRPRRTAAAATRAIAARAAALDPAIATTAFMKEDRGGKVFVDATRAGGATVAAAYSPRLRPGVPVSFPVHLGRPRRRRTRPTSPSATRPACWDRRPVGGADAVAAAPARRAGRGGPGHPGGPGAAMHEGKRRARARRAAEHDDESGPPGDA